MEEQILEAELGKTLQDTFILLENDIGHSPSFNEYCEELGLYRQELSNMLDDSFGSYNNLLRSLGRIPNRGLEPQDLAEKVFCSGADLPATIEELEENGYYAVRDVGRTYGSHSALLESLGLFEKHYEKITDLNPVKDSPNILQAIQRRSIDEETINKSLEQKFGKKRSSFTHKYEI